MKSKFRASFTEQSGELVGSVEYSGHLLFTLECLAEIVSVIAAKSGVPADEVVRDLYSITTNKVRE